MSRFDVVVVGGGPAGMIAAARAAQYGARTALIEKNRELGRKLMLTGRGRCNFAHDEEDPEVLIKGYRHGGEFMLPSIKKFGTKETIAFFLRRGVAPSHERGHRIYPKEGMDATAIVNALWTALKDGGVQVLRGVEVRSLDLLGGKARRLITTKQEIEASAFIIATGGLSFPGTGATGDGYRFAKKAGHKIIETEPALCPVKIADRIDDYIDGLKLKNVRVTLTQDGEKVDERFGEMDFTPFGISGAIIMDMASSIGDSLKKSKNVQVHIDLKPALEPERLDARIDRDFAEFSTDALRFALRKMLPGQIIPETINRAGLDLGKPCGETTPEERHALRNVMKDFAVTPTALLGFRHAIITSGGVDTDEVDPETMASKFIPNLYFAGELLNVDGPTGGYNLQECWSTGFAAGSAAASSLGFSEPTDEQIVQQMFEAKTRRDNVEKEEKLKLKELSEQHNEDMSSEENENTQKENPEEDMTIKTGPTDDKEFCGWRDPRKNAGVAGAKAESSDKSTKSEHNYSERYQDNRSKSRHYAERNAHGERSSFRNRDDRRRSEYGSRREGRNRYDERRSYGERNSYGERSSFRGGYDRYDDDYKPRRENRDRYDERRSYGERDSYGERSSFRGGYDRYDDDYRPRRENRDRYNERRSYGDRDSYGERSSFRGRHERYDDDYRPRRDNRGRYDEGKSQERRSFRDKDKRYNNDYRPRRDEDRERFRRKTYSGQKTFNERYEKREDFSARTKSDSDNTTSTISDNIKSDSATPRKRRFTNFEKFRKKNEDNS